MENQSGTHTCHKNLTMKERLQSSTWRELLAVEYALKSFAPLLQNTSIHLKTDNFSTSVITRKGSNKTSLQEFAENINKVCVENSTKFRISWIPRNNNAAAETISKLIDHHDWKTTVGFFQKISKIWRKLTIDRFANNENTKTEKFNSKYWCPGTSNVNAFTVSWSGENNYLVSSIYLIPQVIAHIKQSSSKGVLVLPYWPSAAYWPLIATSKTNFLPFVTDYRIFDNPSQ